MLRCTLDLWPDIFDRRLREAGVVQAVEVEICRLLKKPKNITQAVAKASQMSHDHTLNHDIIFVAASLSSSEVEIERPSEQGPGPISIFSLHREAEYTQTQCFVNNQRRRSFVTNRFQPLTIAPCMHDRRSSPQRVYDWGSAGTTECT